MAEHERFWSPPGCNPRAKYDNSGYRFLLQTDEASITCKASARFDGSGIGIESYLKTKYSARFDVNCFTSLKALVAWFADADLVTRSMDKLLSKIADGHAILYPRHDCSTWVQGESLRICVKGAVVDRTDVYVVFSGRIHNVERGRTAIPMFVVNENGNLTRLEQGAGRASDPFYSIVLEKSNPSAE